MHQINDFDYGHIIMTILYILFGSTLLYFGADFLVRGSSTIALKLNVKPLIVGLTVVAFGTSAPELVVSVKSALANSPDLAVGNVIGSNIFNTLLILGIASIIRPIKTHINLLKWDIPVALFATILLGFLLFDRKISSFEGIILFSGIILYILVNIKKGKQDVKSVTETELTNVIPHTEKSIIIQIIFVAVGIIGLVFGSNFFVNGAVQLAKYFNVSEAVIGVTIVAAGTSLPELATSAVASMKNEGDISVGNILGSNIFNIFCILGIAAIVHPIVILNITVVDFGMLLLSAILIFPIMRTKFTLSRFEGLLLLLFYIIYIIYIVINIS